MSTIQAIKSATGTWQLWVLAAPFGSPSVKDAHGDYFTAHTDFDEARWPLPVAMYYHGYDEPGKQSPRPVYIGRAIKAENRADGRWYLVELDQTKPYAKTVWDAANKKQAAASPGTADHLIRRSKGGHLDYWPILEVSIFETHTGKRPANPRAVAMPALKAIYDAAGIALPIDDMAQADDDKGAAAQRSEAATPPTAYPSISTKESAMAGKDNEEDVDLQEQINAAVAAALQARDDAAQAEAAREAAIKAEVERRLEVAQAEATKAAATKAAAVNRRLPLGGGNNQAPAQTRFSDVSKYDNLNLADQSFLIAILSAAQKERRSHGPGEAALKAFAIKAQEDQTWIGERTRRAIKGVMGDDFEATNATKANELNRPDLASYGDEWVAETWSNQVWEKIRLMSAIVSKIPTVEIPQGVDKINLPLESTPVTFYKVASAADLNATTGRPDATVPASRLGTAEVELSTSKLGARVVWAGEMEEDSILPWIPELRGNLEKEGMEHTESAVLDGDTATAATTNINDIGNLGAQVATTYYLLFNGFRKLALITNAANSRDGGVLALEDFIETMRLMGTAGINALDRLACSFIVDPSVYYKALQLTQVLTRDVFSSPTIEGGQLTGIYGFELLTSANLCRTSANRLSNAVGKVDQTTPANNTKGQIVAVRWDQWRLGFKRRMTMEVSRYPESDANQIVMLSRIGLINRDNEASAVSYNITV